MGSDSSYEFIVFATLHDTKTLYEDSDRVVQETFSKEIRTKWFCRDVNAEILNVFEHFNSAGNKRRNACRVERYGGDKDLIVNMPFKKMVELLLKSKERNGKIKGFNNA